MTEKFRAFRGTLQEFQFFVKKIIYIDNPIQIQKGTGMIYPHRDYLDNPLISQDKLSGKIFMMGNEHEEIVPFLELAIINRWIFPPIKIGSYDFHYDTSQYNDIDSLSPSWQRYGIDLGLWTNQSSHTIVPAYPANTSTFFVEHEAINESEIPQLDVASLETDYFNYVPYRGEQWNMMFNHLKKRFSTTLMNMVFCTPKFCRHPRSLEIARELFITTKKTP